MELSMKTKGIRISDIKDNVLAVTISDIMREISDGLNMHWYVLFLDGMPKPEKGKLLNEYQNLVRQSKCGLPVNWNDLLKITDNYFQLYEAIILGIKNDSSLVSFQNDREMRQVCDVVIELIDCAFWEIFSRDPILIEKLKKKFQKVEILDPEAD